MQSKMMFFDSTGRPWPTEAEANTADDRIIAWKIIGDFAALENGMRERLQGQQPMLTLDEIIQAISLIYWNNVRAPQTKGETNVGHDGAVDGRDAQGYVGSDAAARPIETAETPKDKEAG
jgi:hypothetical protein